MLVVLLCILMQGCRPLARTENGTTPPSPPPISSYESSLYCFNQRYIVSSGGLYGIVDTLGRVLVPISYDSVDFLSDEVSLLGKDGLYFLSDKDGRVFAQSMDENELTTYFQRLHEDYLLSQSRFWDSVLDSFEDMSGQMLSLRGRRLSKTQRNLLLSKKEEIERLLGETAAPPTEQQRMRFERIVERYREIAR